MILFCFIEADGCQIIIKLEHLQAHLNSCEFKLNSEIICGKGCNMKMSGREYQTHNCYLYLQEENKKMNDELNVKVGGFFQLETFQIFNESSTIDYRTQW